MASALARIIAGTLVFGGVLAGHGAADTTAFTIIDDPVLDDAVAQVRADFLAAQWFDRLNATILVANPDGTWSRGSYNQDNLQYPASCVKLAYMAAAMYWCRTNGHPYEHLDSSVRPMITVSDNVATGVVVDTITGAPNTNGRGRNPISFEDWYQKRLYTENFLASRGLLGNQTILHKTYPTNSGSTMAGYELEARNLRGPNTMNSRLSASLMLEIQKGAIEPGANAYMRGLLTHARFGGDSSIGFGMPPGSVFENKIGIAYDTLEDIAYVQLPNGREFILAAYSNGWDRTIPYPYDGASLGIFAEMLVEAIGLDEGNPPKIKIDNADPGVTFAGSWTTATAQPDKFGPSYAYATGGSGATATFALDVPETGKYEVVAWWAEGANRATNAPFTIHHAGGSTTINLNQTRRGGCWVMLGDFDFTAGSGSVVLGTSGVSSSQLVVADAIKITKWPDNGSPTDPPAPGTDVIVDNDAGSPHYVETGSWSTSATNGYNGSTYRFASVGANADATWMAELTETGNYQVFAYYRAGTNRATAARYDIPTGNGVQTVHINQTQNDQSWVSLGTFPLAQGVNVVSLNAQGSSGGSVVIADAVRFTLDTTPPPPPATTASVASVATEVITLGGGNKRGRATVTVRDNNGNPVDGASVTVTFGGSYNESVTAPTGATGVAILTTSQQLKGNVTVSACVTAVVAPGLDYDPGGNTQTCSGN